MGFLELFRPKADASPTFARQPSAVPRWIPAGGSFHIGPHEVRGGLVYVGSGWDGEPALIEPGLPIDWNRPDRHGTTMGYWPFYETITPQARAAYIEWLAGGRSDPQAYIGYVFLFYYGLERRVLVDVGGDPGHPDVQAVAAEVRRLLSIYGENYSFQHYASSFLELIEAVELVKSDLGLPNTSDSEQRWDVPLPVKLGLGRYVVDGSPIPPEWALVWLREDPLSYLRTAASRCPNEFDDLFRLKYRERYGDGAVITPSGRSIELSYRPASASLGGEVNADLQPPLPDITMSEPAIGPLRELARECADELAAYSRYLGRHPDGAGTAPAVGLLPEPLVRVHGGQLVQRLERWTASLLEESAFPVVEVDELVDRWWAGRTEKLTKPEAVSLATLLATLGVGMAPDVRFGGAKPKPGGSATLFRLSDSAAAAPSEGYESASLLVRLAGLLAAADGTISDDEHSQLATYLESALALDDDERQRLGAELEWVGAQELSLTGLKRRVETLGDHEREVLGEFLIRVAVADGQVTPDEITMLTKLYRLLGLNEADIYSAVHAFEAGDAGPVTVRTADPDTGSRVLPPKPGGVPAGIRVDREKLAARRAETAAVAALLSDVFEEEEDIATPQVSEPETTIGGLDAAHSGLVVALGAHPEWSREELEREAAGLGLHLLDGSIERINDASIDVCEEPLIEGDDPYEINGYALEAMA